jgi:hypothetical protein
MSRVRDLAGQNERHMSQKILLRRAAILMMLLLFFGACAFGQQTYVTRFDAFAGYTFLNSPSIGLWENGFHTQAGVRANKWLSFGFDYSISKGDATLTPNLLLTSLQQTLGAQIAALIAAGLLPPNYMVRVPFSSTTHTFAGGPQISYRHFKQVTLFVRPSVGIIKEEADPHPTDPVAQAIVAQLAPGGKKTDNVIFYGFGGGVDLNFSRHVALRVQSDFVRDHLFDDLLQNPRNTVRFSVGPAFNFGKNIAEK